MKLAPLLAQYLYTNKKLDLPGIGTFLLDPSIIVEPENNKNTKLHNLEGISFESNTSNKETTDLVAFISLEAGKMKALAAADLDSHLQQALQFLNIGKPFLFEGIGSLVKLQSGQFEFEPGKMMVDKMLDHPVKTVSATSVSDESMSGFDTVFYHERRKLTVKKPVATLFLIGGLALAIGGGYIVYKKTSGGNNSVTPVETKTEKVTPVKNDELASITDSLPQATLSTAIVQPQDDHTSQPGNIKFVVEVANKARALERFGTLKGWGLNIQMETKDSASYNLFFVLPALASDTTRIADSLTVMYSPLGKKAFAVN